MKRTVLSIIFAGASLICAAQSISTYCNTCPALENAPVPAEDRARPADGIKTSNAVPLLLEVPRDFVFERRVPKPKEGEPVPELPLLDNTRPAFEKHEHIFGSSAAAINASEEKPFLAIELFGRGRMVPIEIVDAFREDAANAALSRGRYFVADAQSIIGSEYNGDPVWYGGNRGTFAMSPRLAKLYTKGVRYVLSATVDEYMTHVFKSGDPKNPYRFESAFSFHVTGYDLDRQEILQTRLYVVRGDGRSFDEADSRALESARSEMKSYINANFRRIGRIADLGDPNKKDKIKSCTIKVGFADGAVKGDTYQVCTLGENGSTNNLGRVRITNVLTEDLSECTISVGKEKVVSAFEDGIPLVLVTD